MAAQLTGMKGCPARLLAEWMAWANSSLPVPLSPQIMTGEELVAAERASWMHSCRASSRPTMLEKV